MAAEEYNGMVKSYNGANGYGFIECGDTFSIYGRDIFLHREEFLALGGNVGAPVKFTVDVSDKGQPRAKNVVNIGGVSTPKNSAPTTPNVGADFFGAQEPTTPIENSAASIPTSPQKLQPGQPPVQRRVGALLPPPKKRASEGGESWDSWNQQGAPIGPPTGIPDSFVGQIRTFNAEKGYGYVHSEECAKAHNCSTDIYLHYSQAINFRVGDYVNFSIGYGQDGKMQAERLEKHGASSEQESGQDWSSNASSAGKGYGKMGGGGKDDFFAMKGKGKGDSGKGSDEEEFMMMMMMKGKGKGGKKGKFGTFNCYREYSGIVKSYNSEKGYGFIDNEEIKTHFGRDVFLTRGEVEKHNLGVGEDITFVVKVDKGNPQADVIGKTNEMHTLGQDQLAQVGPGPHKGLIKSYNDQKGFGFIQCTETENAFQCDVFLHKREMDPTHQVGVEVEFHIILNNRGKPQATNVQVIGEGLSVPQDEAEEGGWPVEGAAAPTSPGMADDMNAHNMGMEQGGDWSNVADVTNWLDSLGIPNTVEGAGGPNPFAHAEWEPDAKRQKVDSTFD